MVDARRFWDASLLALPGALVVYFGFNAGGFFPGTEGYIAALLLAVLAARIAFSSAPFSGLSRSLGLCCGALGLYAALCLLSGLWSDAWARALVEFDRALLYLLLTLLLGLGASTPSRVRWILRGIAVGIVFVAVAALTTRLLPDVWSAGQHSAGYRLSFPLTYWNALGLLAALGIVICTFLTCDDDEATATRVAAAAAIPLLATTILFTFSRGAILVGIVGVLTYLATARPRGIYTGLLACAPATAIAVTIAYGASVLQDSPPLAAAALEQGRHVALAVGACAVGAGLVRGLLALADRRRQRRGKVGATRSLSRTQIAVGCAVVVAALLVVVASGFASRQIHRLNQNVSQTQNVSARLTDPSNDGRFNLWHAALDEFSAAPVVGHGAGTFEVLYARDRPTSTAFAVLDAHSIYLENLAELGVVGLCVMLVVLGTILVGTALRARGALRPLYGAVFALMLVWAISAGIDWDWEMPAVTVPFFALGGAVLARPEQPEAYAVRPAGAYRGLACAGCLLIALAPALVALSQSKLSAAVRAFDRGQCLDATTLASASISRLSIRPEPYEIQGYCALGSRAAVTDMKRASDRDPKDWEYRYGYAVARAAAGLNPGDAIRAAHELNPLEPLVADILPKFESPRRSAWIRAARTARIPSRLATADQLQPSTGVK